MKNGITLERLQAVFVGQKVKITHPYNPQNNRLSNREGVCAAVHKTETGVDFELADRSRWGLAPDELTQSAVEGDIQALITARRRVEIVKA